MKQVCIAALVCLTVNLTACGGGGSSSPTTPAPNDTTNNPPSAPAEHWGLARAGAASVDVSQADVDAILDHLFSDAATQSALVSKDGYVVGERYADGFDADSLGTSWSVAKSFYSAAMGVAIEEGHFSSVTQKASTVLTEFVDTDKEEITIEQILRMRSGLAANTDVFFSGDQTAHALANTLVTSPGAQFSYSNANPSSLNRSCDGRREWMLTVT